MAKSTSRQTNGLMILVGSFMLLLVSAACGSPSLGLPVLYEVGETARLESLHITVDEVKLVTNTPGLLPDPNYRFVALHLTIENQGTEPVQISSYFQAKIRDENGRQYSFHPRAAAAAGATVTIDGLLEQNAIRRGIVAYQVPHNVSNYIWSFIDSETSEQVLSAAPSQQARFAVRLPTEPSVASIPTTPTTEVEFSAQQIASLGDLSVTIHHAKIVTATGRFEADAGHVFVVLDVSIENEGNDTWTLSSSRQMTLQDGNGGFYAVDIAATMDEGSPPDGRLNAGEKVRGLVGYQVPISASELTWTFQQVYGVQRIIFPLEPSRPEGLPVSTTEMGVPPLLPPLQSVGDTVAIGDLLITVLEAKTFPATQGYAPEAGARFVSVAFTIENAGSQAADIFSLLQMFILDERGQFYDQDAAASLALGSLLPLDGRVLPNSTASGVMGYQIPVEAQGLRWVFDDLQGNRISIVIAP